MNVFQKLAGAATVVASLTATTNAFAACEEWGQQSVPPHTKDNYRIEHSFSGSPLGTLQSCLAAVAANEDIVERDNLGLSFQYTSRAQGNFNAQGYAEQPGADLNGSNKPRNSVAIARITSESGNADGLDEGNIAEYSLSTRKLQVYTNWQDFQNNSPNAGLFPRQP